MNTFWHMFWTYAVFRNKKYLPLTIFGAFFPDTHYFIAIVISLIKSKFTSIEVMRPWTLEIVKLMSNILNSFVIIFIIFLLLFILKLRSYFPFIYAWIFHVTMDFSTHVIDAYSYLWPITTRTFTLGLSYWEEVHHSFTVNLINFILFLGFMAYLFISKHKFRDIECNIFKIFTIYLILNIILIITSVVDWERSIFLVVPTIMFIFIMIKNKISSSQT